MLRLRSVFSTAEGRALREARRMVSQPVAARPEWVREMMAAVIERDAVSLRAIGFGWGSAVQSAEAHDGIGIVEIRGPLVQGMFFSDYSDIREAVEHLAADGGVRAILLDIDSPGGDVHAEQFALAETIRSVRARMPVWSLANGQATSAAYLLAAQASKVFAASASTTVIGSIGVIAVHADFSAMNERIGVKLTEIVTGRHKNELSHDRPLGRGGRETIEMLVEGAFKEMISAITAGRKALTEESIREQEAAIYLAGEAQDLGLIDGVETRDELVAQMARQTNSGAALRIAATEGGNMTLKANQPGAQDVPVPETELVAPAAPEPAAPSADPAPQVAAVIDLDAERVRLRGEERAEACSIVEACHVAGLPSLAATLLADSGMTRALAVQRIQEARIKAGGHEIHSEVDAASSGAAAVNPLHHAIETMVASRAQVTR